MKLNNILIPFFILIGGIYIFQFLFHYFNTERYAIIYNFHENVNFWIFFIILIFICLTLYFSHHINKLKIYQPIKLGSLSIAMIWLFYLIPYGFCALIFFQNFGIDFRHQNRMSEAGLIVMMVFFFQGVFWFYIFYLFTKILRKESISISEKLGSSLASTFTLLTLNSSLIIPVIILGYVVALAPKWFLKILFQRNEIIKNKRKISKSYGWMIIPLAVAIVFPLTMFFGVANKIGIQQAWLVFSDLSLANELFAQLLIRLSTHYSSLVVALNSLSFSWDINLVFYELQTFLNRIGALTGLFKDLNNIEITTTAKAAHDLVYRDFHATAGLSPGIIATSILFPFFPLGIILIPLYISLIVVVFSRYLPDSKISLVSTLIISYFLLPYLENPLEVFQILTPFNIMLFLLIWCIPKKDNVKESTNLK